MREVTIYGWTTKVAEAKVWHEGSNQNIAS